jgi:uncharacterized iron-regulated membrane protein
MTPLQQWIRQPQTVWLRKAIFQIHLWSGIGLGLYVLLVSVTGSIVVFSNELYRAASRDPITISGSGPRLTDDQLRAAAHRAYPGYSILVLSRPPKSNQPVSISLKRGASAKNRIFDPYTGADLGNSVPPGIIFISRLLSLHDDLMSGPTGRQVNGFGAFMIAIMALTGIIVWWPGIASWRRSLTVPRHVGWPRFIWGLHGMIGFWTFAFVLMFGLSGIYLGDPERFQELADRIQPLTEANARSRLVDQIIYWLAYLHVGRINGIGLMCRGPGLCDVTVKSIWCLFGLAPAAMFVTGVIMWWNRVLKKKLARA